ncbi:sensor histidine kinase [Holdemania sp. 1001302B_160321_E10]|uniref:sensor histidine kinase n=1 Tax=Holdemania sp. 1001302B_160321_E10 TaxID=2787120 RepID=UPI00189A0961|nr:sensor histidine kinase [Holdemania sp. 1001302B_160321_E10]
MFEFAGAAMEVWAVHRLFSALPQRSTKWKTPLLIAAVLACVLLVRVASDRYHTTYYLIYYWILGLFLLLDRQSDFKNFIYNWMLIFFLNFPIKRAMQHLGYVLPRHFPGLPTPLIYLAGSVGILLVFELARRLLRPQINRYLHFWTLLAMSLCLFSILYMNLLIASTLDYAHLIAGWFDASLPLAICVLLCVCGLAFVVNNQKTVELIETEKNLQLRVELKHKEIEQIQLKKELIERTNREYHDMKNHLKYLEQLSQPDQKAYLHALQKEMQDYIPIVTTDNDALDTVLSDKTIQARQDGIALTVSIEYQNLAFLQPMDIVTLFGNALDNAIEACRKLKAGDRKIRLRITQRDGWLLIQISNPLPQPLTWSDGRPASTKDGAGHGLGLRSIEKTTEHLGGIMQLDAADNQFTLQIFLPICTD